MSHINPGSNLWSARMTSSSRIIAAALIIFVAGCGSVLKRDSPGKNASASGAVSSAKKRGGYYLDDGPGENPRLTWLQSLTLSRAMSRCARPTCVLTRR